jgi:glycosyltransferase involved in cell wall biosynthesis
MISLSICIPIFRSDVRKLVLNLRDQMKRIDTAQIDIVLIDDSSGEPYPKLNSFADTLVKTINLEQNIGRAKIRNLFLQHSTSRYLLFLDGDSTVLNEKFLFNYIQALEQQDALVLVGASCYQLVKPDAKYLLRWRYSTQRESLNYEQRLLKKNAGFKTNNFIIDRSILEAYPFEEGLSGYGHEDTLFGVVLCRANIEIVHLDNPVWNLNLDDNTTFLSKTEQALQNLLWINAHRFSKELLEHNLLLATFLRLKNSFWGRLLLQGIEMINPFLKRILQTGKAPMCLFDIFRLGRLSALHKQHQ